MTDPYEVLNIPSTATDEEVKKAYRDLARKYHPDNYHDNPLADLAQEKMKEINAAYDAIQRERGGRVLLCFFRFYYVFLAEKQIVCCRL